MSGQILDGNSMDDYPLTLTSIVERAERFHADRAVVSRRPSGAISRTTLGACTGRARRLAGALAALGVGEETPSPRCCGIKASTWNCTLPCLRWARSSTP